MSSPVDVIRQVNASTKDAYTFYPVVIIGAGESGICMGCRLQQVLGFDQFRIFERRSALGGTWVGNCYPGVACDVTSMMYSFSFAQNPSWTAPLPSGKEIVRYLYDVCAKFKMLDKIQCDTSVKCMTWIEEDEEWELILEHLAPGIGDMSTVERKAVEADKGVEAVILRSERIRAKVVCSAVGGLVEPKPPVELPGKENFEGRIIHTARWDPDIDLKDKHVVVVGTGCSAGQVVPKLITEEHGPAKQVTQLLRSPPWTVPFLDRKSRKVWREWVPFLCTNVPGFQNTFRKFLFTMAELEWYSLFDNNEAARERRKVKAEEVLAYMRKKVPEEYHEILTPNYELFCKRRIIDEGWFDSLNDPRVDITSMPLTSFGPGPREVTLGPGHLYPPPLSTSTSTSTTTPTQTDQETKTLPCDVLVLANGYETNVWLHPLEITGRNGTKMHELWSSRGGPQAYLGCAVDSFPSFFLLFGPNTATGHTSVILASENMTNYALNFIGPILRREVRTAEVKKSAVVDYTVETQRLLKDSVYQSGGCVNWYADRKTGWNSSTYPRSQVDFTIRCMFPVWWHWNVKYTRKGLLKLWAGRLFRIATLITTLVVGRYLVKFGRTAFRERVFGLIDQALSRVGGALGRAGIGGRS